MRAAGVGTGEIAPDIRAVRASAVGTGRSESTRFGSSALAVAPASLLIAGLGLVVMAGVEWGDNLIFWSCHKLM